MASPDKPADTAYPVHDLIARRWSPRSFTERPVSREVLGSVFEAARWAASSFNDQPWGFVVATSDDPAGHAAFVECLVPGNRAWAERAPVLVLSAASLEARHSTAALLHSTAGFWANESKSSAFSALSLPRLDMPTRLRPRRLNRQVLVHQ